MSDKSAESDLSAYLKSGLNHAIQSYESFRQSDIPDDAKGFTAYHNACKSALLHISLLMKLIQGTNTPPLPEGPDWLAAARHALETEEDDDMLFS